MQYYRWLVVALLAPILSTSCLDHADRLGVIRRDDDKVLSFSFRMKLSERSNIAKGLSFQRRNVHPDGGYEASTDMATITISNPGKQPIHLEGRSAMTTINGQVTYTPIPGQAIAPGGEWTSPPVILENVWIECASAEVVEIPVSVSFENAAVGKEREMVWSVKAMWTDGP